MERVISDIKVTISGGYIAGVSPVLIGIAS